MTGWENIIEFELSDAGGVRIFSGRLSDDTRPAVFFDATAVCLARQLVGIVANLAEATSYYGSWLLGIGGTGLKGKASFSFMRHANAPAPVFSEPTFRHSTVVTYPELVNRPGTVTRQLVGRLLRAVGTGDLYRLAFANPPHGKSESTVVQ